MVFRNLSSSTHFQVSSTSKLALCLSMLSGDIKTELEATRKLSHQTLQQLMQISDEGIADSNAPMQFQGTL